MESERVLEKLAEEIRHVEELKFENDAKKRIQSARRAHALNRKWLAKFDYHTGETESMESLQTTIDECEHEMKILKEETLRLNSQMRDLGKEERQIKYQMQEAELRELDAEVFSLSEENAKPSVIDNGDLATRMRATKLLAELAPRYQLQYKIDLALQKMNLESSEEDFSTLNTSASSAEEHALAREFSHDRTSSTTSSSSAHSSVESADNDVTSCYIAYEDVTIPEANEEEYNAVEVTAQEVLEEKHDDVTKNKLDVITEVDDVMPVPKPRRKHRSTDSSKMEVVSPLVHVDIITSQENEDIVAQEYSAITPRENDVFTSEENDAMTSQINDIITSQANEDTTSRENYAMTSKQHDIAEEMHQENAELDIDDVASDVTSSIDEHEENTTQYSYDVTNTSDSEEKPTNEILETEICVANDDVAEKVTDDIINVNANVTAYDETAENDVTEHKVNDITEVDHAESFAPILAHHVVTEGVREAAAVRDSPRDVSGSVRSKRGSVDSNVTEEVSEVESRAESIGLDAIRDDSDLDLAGQRLLEEANIEKEVLNEELTVTNTGNDVIDQEEYVIDTEENVIDKEENVIVKEENVIDKEENVIDVGTIPEPEVTSKGVVILEYPDVFSDVTNEDMRIIERTGLVNRDEIPEDASARSYNAAHSQRNTDATKWFGDAKPKDKVWLKPKGRVDDSAEMERRKVIKAMTKKHNPNYIPKWRPPEVKNWEETLEGQQKESLKKYEERRRQRIESSSLRSDSSVSVETTSSDVSTVNSVSLHEVCPNSEVVVESNVHSRDAINLWESKLHDKFVKEETENKRLSVGRTKRAVRQAKEQRERSESMSSVVSTGSVSGELPSSENIIRESLGVSNVRNKWRNIENQSMSDFRNASPSPRRTNSFTVTPAAAYRSSSVPKSPMRDPVSPSYVKAEAERLPTSPTAVPVNSPRYSRIIPGESFIDREIRESAEREEQWKHEKQDSDIDRLSVTSQSDSLSGNTKFHTDVNYTPVNSMTYNDVTKESPRSSERKEEIKDHSDSKSDISSEVTSPTMPSKSIVFHHNVESEYSEHIDCGADSGIECNAPNVIRSNVTSPTSEHDRPVSLATSSGSHEDEYQSSEVSVASHEEVETPVKPQQAPYSPRVHSLVTPKGWSPRTSSSVTPVSPKQKFTIKPFVPLSPTTTSPEPVVEPIVTETKKPEIVTNDDVIEKFQYNQEIKETTNFEDSVSAITEEPTYAAPTNGDVTEVLSSNDDVTEVMSSNDDVTEVMSSNDDVTNDEPHQPDDVDLTLDPKILEQNPQASVSHVTVTRQKSGPSFEVVSSKNRLQTIMELELKEAEKREEEWKQKQLEALSQNHDVINTVVASQTPTKQQVEPPPASPNKISPVLTNGESTAVKKPARLSYDSDDVTTKKIVNASSSEYKKHTVVKANRVPRRKSNLAMRWEAGKFNNDDE